MPTLFQITLFLFAAVAAVLAIPVPTRVVSDQDALLKTNAGRLARGLAPLRPRNLYTPTRVRRVVPSILPGGTYTGPVGVYSGTGNTLLGYLDSTNKVGAISTATTFRYTQPANSGTATEIFVSTSATSRLALTATLASNLKPGSSSYATVSRSTITTPATGVVTNSGQWVRIETPVFIVDPITFVTTLRWTNGDGTAPGTYLVAVGSTLYATGDVAAFKGSNAAFAGAVPVSLTFAPQ